jgi:type IV pilus assembly protein PilA
MAKASFMQNKKGFTLIELLVVVAIIGLLSTLGVIAFRDAQKKGRDTKRLGDAKAVINAFAQANQEGMVLGQAGGCAAAWSATAAVSTARICVSIGGLDKTTDYINLTAIKDPLYSGATICNGALTTACQPALDAAASLNTFSLYFYMENPTPAAKTANQNGIL